MYWHLHYIRCITYAKKQNLESHPEKRRMNEIMNFDSLGGILDEFDRQVNGAKDARMMKFFILFAVLVIIVAIIEAIIKKKS